MNCIIVDDEPKARKVLEKLIGIHCPALTVLQCCENLTEARIALLEKQPDIVFLDLHLPQEFGLELIQNMNHRSFGLILTTAHEDYAIQAFELNAQDYLLKPIYSVRLKEAVEKARQFVMLQKGNASPTVPAPKVMNRVDKIPIPVEDGIEMIETNNIIRIEASGSYCLVHLVGRKPILVSRHMKPMESLFVGRPFYRIHNSHFINLHHLKKVQRTDGGFAIMSDEKNIEISRRKLSAFVKFLDQNQMTSSE